MFVDSLPPEILQKIFGYCSKHDQKPIGQVCHRWKDAVEYLLLPRTWLKVSKECRTYLGSSDEDSSDKYDNDNESANFSYETELLNRDILLNSTRKYTRFNVVLCNGETDETKQTLKELLDVCQERYQIEQLHLRGSPNKTLVQLFNDHHEWFQNLTFLQVYLYPAEFSETAVGGMVTLSNLKRLIWYEGIQAYQRGRNALWSNSGWNAFALNAPKLFFLSVDLRDSVTRNQLRSGRQDPDMSCMFLPTLELKPGPDLRQLGLHGILNMNQRHIDGSERILQNLEALRLSDCDSEVMVRICDKCSNLKELYVYNPLEGSMPLQISPTLSANLEKLKISIGWADTDPFVLYGPAVFPKLRHLLLNQVKFGKTQDASLDAPQLSTVELFGSHFRQSLLPHTAQIRTMVFQVLRWTNQDLHPPTNLAELGLYLSAYCATDGRLIENYLRCVPHLTRLKVAFSKQNRYSEEFTKLDLTFVESLPKLEHLTIHQAEICLTDCGKLAGLKSLLLSKCTIVADPSDETVVLTAVEYFRAERVTINDISRTVFPLQFNERQPPIAIVSVSVSGRNVFSTKNFTAERDEFVFLLETQ